MSDPKPLRMQMRVKNNRMIKAREEMGYHTVIALCRAVDRPSENAHIGSFENFKRSPIRIANELVANCIAPGCDKGLARMHLVCAAHKEKKDELLKDPAITDPLPHVWSAAALRIAGYLFREPEWLWPEEVRAVKNSVTISVELEVSEARQLSEAATGGFTAKELQGKVSEALRVLSPRQRNIIVRRFGLKGRDEETLSKIAGKAERSRETIRRVESDALRKLRHAAVSKKLKPFID